MSLILDALKKMEQERKARHGSRLDIRPEIVGKSEIPSGKGNRLLLIAAGIALVAVGVTAGFLLKEKPAGRAAAGKTAGSAPSGEGPRQAAAPPAVAPAPSRIPDRDAMSQSRDSRAGQEPPARPLPGEIPAGAAPRTEAKPPREQALRNESPAAPAAAAGQAGDLKVSGIAWQEERGLRRAVVNGELVREGGEIAGARVILIGENSVRFSRGGSTVDVPYAPGFGARP